VYCLELAGSDDAFAAREAATAASDVDVVAPGLATARVIDAGRARRLAYTHRVSTLVGRTDADVASARALLSAASVDREGSVRVRARNVRSRSAASTRAAERELGDVLVDRGFDVDLDDPDHELRALFGEEVCLLGWLTVAVERSFGDRRPTDRPFVQPGSMAPMDARAVANLAGAGPDARLLDPMCGTGGLLLEAGLVGSSVVGADAQWKMARGTRENLEAALGPDAGTVVRADATQLPFRDDAFDAVAFDAPYGRQSKIARHDLSDLVAGALAEAVRVAPRGVLVADREWVRPAVDAGWSVEEVFRRPVHGSLDRYVHLLSTG